MNAENSSLVRMNTIQQTLFRIGFLLMLTSLNGCSLLIGTATQDFGEHMRQTLLNQDDPALVSSALPTYLLSLEALLASQSDDAHLYLTTANLYNAYLTLLPEEAGDRKAQLSLKALNFALKGNCLAHETLCNVQNSHPSALQIAIADSEVDDLDRLYTLATAWAGWIQNNKSDWNAIAQLAQVKAIMQRIIAIDDHYQNGNPYLYLGVLESLIPANLGGQPEVAKQYFEKAMQIAPDNLMSPLLYAKHYARMQYDRELHDRLLNTVLATNPTASGLTLINHLAQQQAKALLKNADQYF